MGHLVGQSLFNEKTAEQNHGLMEMLLQLPLWGTLVNQLFMLRKS